MPQALNAEEATKPTEDQIESGRMRRIRLRQLRTDARARAAEAQDITVRIIERNARYSLWLIIIAGIATMITAAAVSFGIWANVSHAAS